MDRSNAQRLVQSLPEGALVLDVGGGGSVFPRADHVLDLLPYERRNFMGELDLCRPRYSAETWVQWDVCSRQPFPFPDRYFDFTVCSHLLEDVRDPVWVCEELQRVSRAGYIETPSRLLEQTRGVENPMICGYGHHHWLVNPLPGGLAFQFKNHYLHAARDAWVTTLGVDQQVNPRHSITVLEWQGGFEVREDFVALEDVVDNLSRFASTARQVPDLILPRDATRRRAIRRWVWWQRQKLGRGY